MSDWTPDEIVMLARLWKDGKSASYIAEMIPGRTRNSIIGQAHRRGLAKRPSPIKRRRALPAYNTHICEWPSGTGPYTFCGKKTEPNKPYCEFHCRRAYVSKKMHDAAVKKGHKLFSTGKLQPWRGAFHRSLTAEDYTDQSSISSTNVSPHDEFTKEGTL